MFFRALAMALLCAGVASAAEQPIQDGAQMFSAATVSQLDQEISAFTAQTGKQIVVVTVPSLNGKGLSDAAEAVFQQQNINGMLIFIARDDRKDYLLPDAATAQFFPEPTIISIRQSMESLFKAEDYDGGITAAVSGVLNVFRAHLNSAPANGAPSGTYNYPVASNGHQYIRRSSGGISHVFIWIILVVVGYMVLRSIFRAMSGPRYYGGPSGPGVPPGGPGGPGYGGYGYGPGYYGGGGGFWSGLLGGLGGAWLGNEMFGNRGNTIIEQPGGTMMPGDQGGQAGSWGGGDAGGWANDAGQADMGAGSGGDWGGGGFGGGGDFGGGGFGGGDGGGGGGW
jgi:uncharacterized membrane protein YgcG